MGNKRSKFNWILPIAFFFFFFLKLDILSELVASISATHVFEVSNAEFVVNLYILFPGCFV